MSIEFREWPKTPRLNRDMIVTEKIDGSNAAVIVQPVNQVEGGHQLGDGEVSQDGVVVCVFDPALGPMLVAAQSRKRIISPGKQSDNAGFAAWVRENAHALVAALGEGYHYGEWWGSKIARTYGLTDGDKRFSLFNVVRYAEVPGKVPGLDLVPELYRGPFNQDMIQTFIHQLRLKGSVAVPGQKAEGVIVFHVAAGHVYKVLCDNDELPKGVVTAQEAAAVA